MVEDNTPNKSSSSDTREAEIQIELKGSQKDELISALKSYVWRRQDKKNPAADKDRTFAKGFLKQLKPNSKEDKAKVSISALPEEWIRITDIVGPAGYVHPIIIKALGDRKKQTEKLGTGSQGNPSENPSVRQDEEEKLEIRPSSAGSISLQTAANSQTDSDTNNLVVDIAVLKKKILAIQTIIEKEGAKQGVDTFNIPPSLATALFDLCAPLGIKFNQEDKISKFTTQPDDASKELPSPKRLVPYVTSIENYLNQNIKKYPDYEALNSQKVYVPRLTLTSSNLADEGDQGELEFKFEELYPETQRDIPELTSPSPLQPSTFAANQNAGEIFDVEQDQQGDDLLINDTPLPTPETNGRISDAEQQLELDQTGNAADLIKAELEGKDSQEEVTISLTGSATVNEYTSVQATSSKPAAPQTLQEEPATTIYAEVSPSLTQEQQIEKDEPESRKRSRVDATEDPTELRMKQMKTSDAAIPVAVEGEQQSGTQKQSEQDALDNQTTVPNSQQRVIPDQTDKKKTISPESYQSIIPKRPLSISLQQYENTKIDFWPKRFSSPALVTSFSNELVPYGNRISESSERDLQRLIGANLTPTLNNKGVIDSVVSILNEIPKKNQDLLLDLINSGQQIAIGLDGDKGILFFPGSVEIELPKKITDTLVAEGLIGQSSKIFINTSLLRDFFKLGQTDISQNNNPLNQQQFLLEQEYSSPRRNITRNASNSNSALLSRNYETIKVLPQLKSSFQAYHDRYLLPQTLFYPFFDDPNIQKKLLAGSEVSSTIPMATQTPNDARIQPNKGEDKKPVATPAPSANPTVTILGERITEDPKPPATVTFKRKDKTTQHLYEHPEFQRITQEFLKFVEERQINHKGFSLETSAAYRNWTFAETIDDSSTLKCGIQFVELPDNKSKIVTAMTDDLLDSNDAAKRDFAESIMKCQLECFHNPKVTVSMDCATDTDIDKVIETVKLLNSTGQLKDGALNIQIKLSESYTPPEKYKDFLASCKDIKSIEALLETVKEDKHTMRSK